MKKKKIFAFYDILYYLLFNALFFAVLIIIYSATDILSLLDEWIKEAHLLQDGRRKATKIIVEYGPIIVPIISAIFIRYAELHNAETLEFPAQIFSRPKKQMGVDWRWNAEVFLSEVKSVEEVHLTQKEQKEIAYQKHWFDTYLKVDLKHGGQKYIYVGNFTKRQIKKIIAIIQGA